MPNVLHHKKKFHLPHMATGTFRTVASCRFCTAKRGTIRKHSTSLMLLSPSGTLEFLFTDILRTLSKSKRGVFSLCWSLLPSSASLTLHFVSGAPQQEQSPPPSLKIGSTPTEYPYISSRIMARSQWPDCSPSLQDIWEWEVFTHAY